MELPYFDILHKAEHILNPWREVTEASHLLQATLVLWVYGNLSDGQGNLSVTSSLLKLSETDSAGLENYLCYGEGQPGLSVSSRELVPLSDLRSVVKVVQGIIHQNRQQASFPFGTDEVYLVLIDLQTCSSNQP
ncbi:hypothetical protein BDV24DRAFT_167989 [Aspergillus arachidicola]|uniref:Uncharacterized protein n=1 Tax=Aspergillus arachidicola TaxID=656916 RepID=A0A5N6XWJ2_9EURO|nr:hypothetical protein BDV24DRAFT_167989 [Aspergillus arachidicola]